MRVRNFLSWLGLFVAVFSLSACSRSSGKLRLAFVSNNPHGFWTYAQRGCEAAAKELDIELMFRRPEQGTAAKQQEIIEELLVKGVKGIAISPNDPTNLQGFLKTKVASRIPLLTQDNDVPDTKVRRAYIGTHNYRAGQAAGALVERALPKGGKIAIFVGQMDATNAVERRQGVLDFLAGKKQDEIGERTPANATNVKFGNYLLVDTRTDGGKADICQQKAEELLLLHDDLDCLVGLWEYNPPALLRAVRTSKNAQKPAIVAFDENFQTLEAIQSGEIVGTVVQNPYMFGYESIKILAALAKGDDKALKDRKDIDAENRIYVPHRIIIKGAGDTKIADSATIDVDVFYPEVKKLKGEGS
ncbi:MAG: substrate-binding domain-containing protein [Gemmataceae bacterium]|nr:substrate-binding domain-containing protein [Gemmataceae bacterium]MCI0741251.1 substrate-binding domain-containing protein [Gemmataceae bacterium]